MQFDQTNTDEIEKLAERLSDAYETKRVLRLCFVDDEVYDLARFAVCQEIGEEYPHCTAIVVCPVRVPEHKRELFSSDVAMFFSLNDIIEVRDAATEQLLFKA